MRVGLILAPLLLCPAPLWAQPVPQQVEQALADPALTNKLVDMVQSLSTAMLQLPVGDLKAAAEGRKATSADHRRTVASESRMSEREMRARIEAARPVLRQSMKTLAQALPAMMQSLDKVEQSMERAAANMPDPNYPRR